ncbi:MAG TPA: hypothetical protein VGY77_05460 [Gemmataceae bacterium]|jgi:hypothetical protein|nr:hypothetical protein [Gemmataceae bacterium]
MALVPHRFLVRLAYQCQYRKDIPHENEDRLLDLPELCRLDNFAEWDDKKNFADVRLGWNESGLGIQVHVRGKQQSPQGDEARPRISDGVTLWLDTRDARTSHRATRYCHQFHFLPTGAGSDHDEPAVIQTKINRALQDAPMGPIHSIPFNSTSTTGGYLLEAFLPHPVLHGFDPEQNPRLGFFYVVRDSELGEQVLSVDSDFPYWEDPSLWSVLELVGQK